MNFKLLKELEINVCEAWLKSGAITLTEEGEENSYYTDIFDRDYYCKNL